MTFELLKVRFRFRATDRLRFPAGRAGNILRGAFGLTFRNLACVPECADPASCSRRSTCVYARTFEPRAACGRGPSGLADWPRPFVFRASHLDGRIVEPGQDFDFYMHLFERQSGSDREPSLPYFVRTFRLLGESGFGPGRGRAELTDIEQQPVVLRWGGTPRPASHATVQFVTPTELKSGSDLAGTADFGILFARLRDRLSTLRALYGSGPLEIDFRAWGKRAESVRLIRSDLRWVEVNRRSSRTGQVHPIGGFTGEVEYGGELGEFLPYLEAGQWIGVGRQTVWGKGEIRLLEVV